jgi:serine/threonine protein phosphatase PrpC
MTAGGVRASIGFHSERGARPDNQDFAAALLGWELSPPRRDVIAALADGVGGASGGRVAAELAVRGFLDGISDSPENANVPQAGAAVIRQLNAWIHAQGQRDSLREGMATTFTAIIFRGHGAHLFHVGDSRAYRLRGNALSCLTGDHLVNTATGPALSRALGAEAEIRLDYALQPVALHDRFLLCSDGIHAVLAPETLASLLRAGSSPQDAAHALATGALERGSRDNCTALVLDVVALPSLTATDIAARLMELPILESPSPGENVDGFRLDTLVSDGRYSRLFAGRDQDSGEEVVLKFPKPHTASDTRQRQAYLGELWAGSNANSPWLGRVIEQAPGRQSRLYNVMPLYHGELLEQRLARRPAIGLEELRNIGVKLARAAGALNRAGIIHRDIKPDNVMLEAGGSLKLLDLGTVRILELDDGTGDIPGTLAYLAPEMLAGEHGHAATDVYSLGVTLFRALTGEYPYGNLDAISPARLARPKELCALRPDLPAWLETALARAVAKDPAERFEDMRAFAEELEAGPAMLGAPAPSQRTFYDRHPILFWQLVSALLAIAVILAFFRR